MFSEKFDEQKRIVRKKAEGTQKTQRHSNLENILNTIEATFTEAFDFEHKASNENLLKVINEKLQANPEKIEDFYKIVIALTK